MESSRNIKRLKARQNWRKRSSVVMILKGYKERVRSLQKLIDDTAISHSRSCDTHVLVVRPDMDNNNSDEARLKKMDTSTALMVVFLTWLLIEIFDITFPEIYRNPRNHALLSPMLLQFNDLIVVSLTYFVMLRYICDILDKDRKEKSVWSSREMKYLHYFGLFSAIYLCICSTVRSATFHQPEDNPPFCILAFCLLGWRQSCNSDTKKLQFRGYIEKDVLLEWSFLIYTIIMAIYSADFAQSLFTTSNPLYAAVGMCTAIFYVLFSTQEFYFKGKKEGVKLRRRGMLWWIYYPDPDRRPFGTLTDVYGLISAIYQFIFSAVQCACFILHVDNPIRLCLLPPIFLLCLAFSTTHRSYRTKAFSMEWIFLFINIGLEISSAIFEQLSSRSKPHYALYGMLLAIAAVVISIWELADKGKKERVRWMRRGTWWWFYHPSPHYTPFGTFPDIYGMICGVAQCIFSMVQYVCYLWRILIIQSISAFCLSSFNYVGPPQNY